MEKKEFQEKKLTLPQVKESLEEIGEENLDQFQRRTLDYVAKFSKIESKKAQQLIERLVSEFGLEEDEAIQVVNCMPKTLEELRTFLAGGRKIIEASKLEAIVNLLNENRSAK